MFPNTYLPLNIFETRYLKMINRAISSKNRLIGMIQPNNPKDEKDNIKLFKIGCAGKIIKFEETEDKRYLITLKGLSRFNLVSESANYNDFRVGQVNWNNFSQDLEKNSVKESYSNLKRSLKTFFNVKNIKVNMDVIDACSDYNLVDQIIMICPLAIQEKQLLLETLSIGKRNKLLQSIIDSYASEANISDIIKH